MLSMCAVPLATCFALHRELQQAQVVRAGYRAARWPRRRPATADAAGSAEPEPSGMPFVDRQLECRTRDRAPSTIAATAMPAVFRSNSSGRSVTTPVIAAMRTPRAAVARGADAVAGEVRAVAEDVEADRHVADARRRERDGAAAESGS
mgnify:CR=1 FL=1